MLRQNGRIHNNTVESNLGLINTVINDASWLIMEYNIVLNQYDLNLRRLGA